jgi:predicted RNase H-like HicB family nuclease
MQWVVVIEKAPSNYSAYVPDLPGCVATGHTMEEVKQQIAEAIEFHLEGLLEGGDPLPVPTSTAEYVEVEFPEFVLDR